MATPVRVLSLRELNRALLARQLLLKRAPLSPANAIERLAGLQAQWSPAPYVGLWSRLTRFTIADLERALAERTVVKATAMRGTLHLLSAGDYPHLSVALAAADARSASFIPAGRRIADVDRLHKSVLRFARRARTREALADFIGTQPGLPDVPPASLLWWLIAARGWLVHVPPSGTFGHRRSGDLIAASLWLRGIRTPSVAVAVQHVVRRHLGAFGPASIEDISSWSSLRTPAIRAAIEQLGAAVRPFADERGRALYDLARAPRPPADSGAPPRFLPKWDSTLLAYVPADRVRILAEAHRKVVIGKNGDVAQTFLIDGTVAGTWELALKRDEAILALTPFGRLAKADRLALVEEGERLARFAMAEARAHHVVAL